MIIFEGIGLAFLLAAFGAFMHYAIGGPFFLDYEMDQDKDSDEPEAVKVSGGHYVLSSGRRIFANYGYWLCSKAWKVLHKAQKPSPLIWQPLGLCIVCSTFWLSLAPAFAYLIYTTKNCTFALLFAVYVSALSAIIAPKISID